MFEKEAEENGFGIGCTVSPTIAWQKGAEFGYNKKCEETFELALSQIKHDRAVVLEQNEKLRKANEWHYLKNGDYPPLETDVLICIKLLNNDKTAK